MHHDLRRLTTRKSRRHFTMLLLTLMTTSGGLTLTGSRTTTSSNPLVIGGRVIGERGQDVSVAALLLLKLREEERQRRGRRRSGLRESCCPLPLQQGQDLRPRRHVGRRVLRGKGSGRRRTALDGLGLRGQDLFGLFGAGCSGGGTSGRSTIFGA